MRGLLRIGILALVAAASLGGGKPHVRPVKPPAPEEKPPAEELATAEEVAPPPSYGLPAIEVPRLEDLLRPLEGARWLLLAVCPSAERQALLGEYAALGEEVASLARVLADAGEWREFDAERARIEAERLRAYAADEGAGPCAPRGATPVYDEDTIPALERIARETGEAWMRGEVGFTDRLRADAALLDAKGERLRLLYRPEERAAPVKEERKRR